MTRKRRAHRARAVRAHQRGWFGLVALVVALAIVGWLAMSALKGYGVGGKPAPAEGERTSVASDPRSRARAVESVVVERAREAARGADESAEAR